MTTSPILRYRFIAAFGGALIAAAASTALADSGYVVDSEGKVVTSSFGECVKHSAWDRTLSTPECDPALAARRQAEPTTELAAVEQPAPQPTLIRLSDKRNVMFEFDSATLTPASTAELDRVFGRLREFQDIEAIDIVGHTDSTGPEHYNLTLSEQRAASVSRFLESRGVPASLLSVHGEGEAHPVAENTTREGRARNRRVDIMVSGSISE
jgi:OOP family OmpA-OmpF porin